MFFQAAMRRGHVPRWRPADWFAWKPRAGDWVEVRPAAEILATLDAEGDLDRLPFMPEMLKFAGRRFRIESVAHKTCDTVNRTGGRRLKNAVHLEELRCDGAAHGRCQAECLLFWKTDWLQRVDDAAASADCRGSSEDFATRRRQLDTQTSRTAEDGETVYRCQATRLFEATSPLAWWDIRQYVADVRTGNRTAGFVISTLLLAGIHKLRRLPIGFRASCWLYDRAHRLLRGQPDPHITGEIARGQPTPDQRLNLAEGELVEIRSQAEIAKTVNHGNRNRGLNIDSEMTRSCGEQHRVSTRVERIINEQTGRMMHFKNPCIVLEGVVCGGEYSDRRLLCPRRITAYWREIWLKRVPTGDAGPAPRPNRTATRPQTTGGAR